MVLTRVQRITIVLGSLMLMVLAIMLQENNLPTSPSAKVVQGCIPTCTKNADCPLNYTCFNNNTCEQSYCAPTNAVLNPSAINNARKETSDENIYVTQTLHINKLRILIENQRRKQLEHMNVTIRISKSIITHASELGSEDPFVVVQDVGTKDVIIRYDFDTMDTDKNITLYFNRVVNDIPLSGIDVRVAYQEQIAARTNKTRAGEEIDTTIPTTTTPASTTTLVDTPDACETDSWFATAWCKIKRWLASA